MSNNCPRILSPSERIPSQDPTVFSDPIKVQVSFFSPSSDLSEGKTGIMRLIQALSGKGFEFIPTYGIQVDNNEKVRRMQLVSTDEKWIILFTSKRIDVYRNRRIDETEEEFGRVPEIASVMVEIIDTIVDAFPRHASRLSLVTQHLGNELSDEALDASFEKCAIPLGYHDGKIVKEWSVRSVAKAEYELTGSRELFNIISDIKRSQGQIQRKGELVDFDRLVLDLDVNTDQDNSLLRFKSSDLRNFINVATELRSEMFVQIEERFE